MKTKLTLSALALSAAMWSAAPVDAATLIDTQIPTGGLLNSLSVDSSNWIAESFAISGNALTVDSVKAWVLSTSSGDTGLNFTLAVYANQGGLPALDFNQDNQGRLFSKTVTYSGDGWAGASGLHWALTPGTYWFAIEADVDGPTSLQIPGGGTAANALAVSTYSGARSYSTTGLTPAGNTFGLVVTSVPEPGAALLMVIGLGGLVAVRHRRA